MRLSRPLLTSVLLALPLCPASTLRGQATLASPRAVVDSFFQLVADERFRDAARLMDVDAFDAHRRQSLKYARRAERSPHRMTAAEFRRSDPKMPLVVAEYEAQRFNERARDEPPFTRHEFGYPTLDSLERASPEDALARWLEAHDLRYQMRRALAERGRNGCPAPTREELDRAARPVRLRSPRILGLVVDGDSVAYVLHDEPSLDPELMDRMYPETAITDTLAAPLPERPPHRPWEEVPPSITIVRAVKGRWLVGNTLGFGSSTGFMSFCEPVKAASAHRSH